MVNEPVFNPNDLKVVEFSNHTDFDFTPEMGCMYDGRPIFGKTGAPCIQAGESVTLPYHVGNQLAINLAKVALVRLAPAADPQGTNTNTQIQPLWDTVKLDKLKNSYLTELYSETKPIVQTETDKLMAKVEELKQFVKDNIPDRTAPVDSSESAPEGESVVTPAPVDGIVYKDKQEVIAELQKRDIAHDKRKSKAELEKLLV